MSKNSIMLNDGFLRVAVVGRTNTARTQMAEYFFRRYLSPYCPSCWVASAGLHALPEVHPYTIKVIEEIISTTDKKKDELAFVAKGNKALVGASSMLMSQQEWNNQKERLGSEPVRPMFRSPRSMTQSIGHLTPRAQKGMFDVVISFCETKKTEVDDDEDDNYPGLENGVRQQHHWGVGDKQPYSTETTNWRIVQASKVQTVPFEPTNPKKMKRIADERIPRLNRRCAFQDDYEGEPMWLDYSSGFDIAGAGAYRENITHIPSVHERRALESDEAHLQRFRDTRDEVERAVMKSVEVIKEKFAT